jgi:hypothetical protein
LSRNLIINSGCQSPPRAVVQEKKKKIFPTIELNPLSSVEGIFLSKQIPGTPVGNKLREEEDKYRSRLFSYFLVLVYIHTLNSFRCVGSILDWFALYIHGNGEMFQ